MNNLKKIRSERNSTLVGIMAKARISSVTLEKIEKYDHEPRDEVKQRLAVALGVEVAQIWPGAEAQ